MPLPPAIDIALTRPSMNLPEVSFNAAVAFVQGMDVATNGGILNGFREWLIVKVGFGNNLVWWGLVLLLRYPEMGLPQEQLAKVEDQAPLIEHLHNILTEFYEHREQNGLRIIYLDYEKWLQQQSWYKPGWPGWMDT